MKKVFIFLAVILLLCGCGKESDKNVLKELQNKVDKAESYRMKGTLEIYRNEEKYTYDIDSAYKKGDLFKVNLINKNNNHEQIILKNSKGVYVITPSLNKSFKFQSDWPYNNSQIYLLQPIVTDLTSDNERSFEKITNGYILTSKVNYSSEKDFDKQKVYLDKEKNLIKVEVLDKDENIKMKLDILNVDFNYKFDENYFEESAYYKEPNEKETEEKTTSKVEDIVYPMYVPVDTQLSSQDIIETPNGERVILTFTGESAFTVVQETLNDGEYTNYVYGDPYLVLDTVGSVTDYSVSWISNNIEYSVMSDTMEIDELLTVAQSISVKAISK